MLAPQAGPIQLSTRRVHVMQVVRSQREGDRGNPHCVSVGVVDPGVYPTWREQRGVGVKHSGNGRQRSPVDNDFRAHSRNVIHAKWDLLGSSALGLTISSLSPLLSCALASFLISVLYPYERIPLSPSPNSSPRKSKFWRSTLSCVML